MNRLHCIDCMLGGLPAGRSVTQVRDAVCDRPASCCLLVVVPDSAPSAFVICPNKWRDGGREGEGETGGGRKKLASPLPPTNPGSPSPLPARACRDRRELRVGTPFPALV